VTAAALRPELPSHAEQTKTLTMKNHMTRKTCR
jgi:hypothetical protein